MSSSSPSPSASGRAGTTTTTATTATKKNGGSGSGSGGIFPPPAQSRTVTIAAHVDHGKTTLADNLMEHNGLVSERLAGTLRILDADPEEQRRGITMRASAVGIRHEYTAKHQSQSRLMIIHLVDSPGHADFRQEVTSSLVSCDAALLVLDVVEGMGARTHQVLRETHAHQLQPVLVLNKIDRLCTELRLTPTEAYLRLGNLLETVNAAAAAMLTAAENTAATTATTTVDGGDGSEGEFSQQQEEEYERQQKLWTFDPAINVVFASALYGLGFTVTSLARSLYQSKAVDIKPLLLKQYLFGDYKYRRSDHKALKWKRHHHDDDGSSANLCMFAEFAILPIWEIFHGVAAAVGAIASTTGESPIRANSPGMDQVLQALQVGSTTAAEAKKIASVEDLQCILTRTGANTEQAVLRCILRRYRNLSMTLLDLICEYCPSPVDAQASHSLRSSVLQLQTPSQPPATAPLMAIDDTVAHNINTTNGDEKESGDVGGGDYDDFTRVQQSVARCDPSGTSVAHVSKFMSTDAAHIRDAWLHLELQQGSDNNNHSNNNVLLGLARVLSGKLQTGKEYYCMGPKHTWNKNSAVPVKKAVRLYVVMGSSFVLVDEVPAGHLCAVFNLQELQLKTVTLCDSPNGMPLRGFDTTKVRPLLKVNVEPQDAADADDLERGLVKLSLADAAVEVTATAKGERILACLGELHLEQSIHDLKKMYCRKELRLRISDPIVDFAETTTWFDNETNDFTAFYDDNSPPLRQMSIPPYNEEEGSSFAKQGRMRSILTGKIAAIQMRVVPLVDSLYQSIEQRRVVEGCEEELCKMGRVLKIGDGGSGDTDNNATTTAYSKLVLELLCDCTCSLGSNGTALVETPALRQGTCVRGVESSEEVHVPQGVEKNNKDLSFSSDSGQEAAAAAAHVYKDLQGRIRQTGFQTSVSSESSQKTAADEAAFEIWKDEMKGSAILGGFQLALRAGPICEEPIQNVLVVLEGVEIAVAAVQKEEDNDDGKGEELCWETAKPLSGGMVVSALRIGIRCALLSRPVRLMEGMLRLTLHSSLSGLGPLYSVLSKRRGRVLEESMVDDGTTDLLSITALIPQAEAFGLTSELLSKTRGHVTAPEMIFGHWERLEVDPFWVPTSLEEREDFGDVMWGDASTGVDNPALRYIRQVRQRKGWRVDSSRTVIAAEKQRTLKR